MYCDSLHYSSKNTEQIQHRFFAVVEMMNRLPVEVLKSGHNSTNEDCFNAFISEVALLLDQGRGFLCLTAAVFITACKGCVQRSSDSGNALHAYCLPVGHWLS